MVHVLSTVIDVWGESIWGQFRPLDVVKYLPYIRNLWGIETGLDFTILTIILPWVWLVFREKNRAWWRLYDCSMGDLTLGKRIWEFLLTTLMQNSNIATCWTWVLQDSNCAIQYWVPFLCVLSSTSMSLSIWCIADACSSNLKGGVCVFMLPFWHLSLDYMDHDPFLCRQIPVGLIWICPYHSHWPCPWRSS